MIVCSIQHRREYCKQLINEYMSTFAFFKSGKDYNDFSPEKSMKNPRMSAAVSFDTKDMAVSYLQ